MKKLLFDVVIKLEQTTLIFLIMFVCLLILDLWFNQTVVHTEALDEAK